MVAECDRKCVLCRTEDLGTNLDLQGKFCSPSTLEVKMEYSEF